MMMKILIKIFLKKTAPKAGNVKSSINLNGKPK